jgi:predicted enzyme related to lactoylglutathione lyase
MNRTELKTVPVEPGMFCWFELSTRDIDRGRDFYRSFLRADARLVAGDDGDHTLLDVDGKSVAGVMRMGPEFPEDASSHWLPYIAVHNLDALCREVPKLGGRMCCGPSQMSMGRFAIIADPTEGIVALVEAASDRVEGANPLGPGAFVWCELVTRDVPLASEFYAKLLRWTPQFRVAGATSFIEMKAGSQSVASVFEACADEDRSAAHWCPYLCVEDIHATLATAVRLGGKKLCEPMEIPGLGTYAGLTDPTGAHLALLQPLDQ